MLTFLLHVWRMIFHSLNLQSMRHFIHFWGKEPKLMYYVAGKYDQKINLKTIEIVREITNNIELHITFYDLSYEIREWNGGTQIARGLRACGRRVKTTT